MDSEFEDDPLWYDNQCKDDYYKYVFASTLIVGMPLLLALLYKIYIDSERIRNEQFQGEQINYKFRKATEGAAQILRCEYDELKGLHDRH
jgi:hypothetical protein